ncbi:hypothetical protein QFW96_18065 [Saccharopolyspora sp. TS4A08]|uniref:DUF5709 domain-containing protein n=1 Tax=Saccharopolyspora ipomoeae TaxID=3042027 RepID=A0ABT6PRA2_9PSEU|nr:hypothetical protein [Saccharopolyspora sp. TS4A08]MDI2030544.1 hypothetical protein [Saccharopolyspora sp. TS4A08]
MDLRRAAGALAGDLDDDFHTGESVGVSDAGGPVLDEGHRHGDVSSAFAADQVVTESVGGRDAEQLRAVGVGHGVRESELDEGVQRAVDGGQADSLAG